MRPLTSIALCVSLASFALAETCVIQSKSIGKFDINPLRKSSDYEGISNPDGGDITMNFCGAVKNDPIAAGDAAGAYIQDSRGAISLGKYSTVPQYHNGQLSISYKEGAACPKSNARRSSLIYLQCDKSWSSSGVTLIDSIDDCFYLFTMKTPHACSQSTGGFFSTLWSLTVLLFWILLAVSGGLFVYTRFIKPNSGGSSSGFGGSGNRLGGSGGFGANLGEAVGFVKDMVIIVGVWSLDTTQNLISKFQSRQRQSSSFSASSYNPYSPVAPTAVGPRPGQQSQGGGGADYNSSAWKTTTRGTGGGPPPQLPAKDQSSGQGQERREEETMPGLAGGGSLLDDDEDDEEGDELTMGGTGGIKV
ncbi:hypothetical protein JCM16303_007284 [Sporobolomyces ruberrimus]